MKELLTFLNDSYTAYHATENARTLLLKNGFTELSESEAWKLKTGRKYFVTRNGSSIIAFTLGKGNGFKIVASHTDSPALKLKEQPEMKGVFTRLNVETYGGGLWYSFFDRPLKLAGRTVTEENGALTGNLYTSDYTVVIPSLAIHMNRTANEGFAPNEQTDLLPLFSLGEKELGINAVAKDIYAVPCDAPFECGANGEFICAPRVDNLTSVFSCLRALCSEKTNGVCIAACLDNEEIGSRTRQGAGSDFLKRTLERIAICQNIGGEDFLRLTADSFLISLDNAHSVHPNRPEKCDPTNRAVMGGGVAIKAHANGAYTTDGMTAAIVRTLFDRAGVKHQNFYNRSDMRSGSTLGAISLGQLGIPSVDLGIAQLAMHSAAETFAKVDYEELEKGLKAFYASEIRFGEKRATVIV